MGYFDCGGESAVATCGDCAIASYDREAMSAKPRDRSRRRTVKVIEFSYADLQSATNGFSAKNLLGKGSYGYVYKAHLHRINVVAAVKKTKQAQPTSAAADNEVEILSRIYHPRLVNLLGFAVDPNQRKLIVVEYMLNGSLYDLLHLSEKPPDWVRRTRFALQVAKAVQFLHSSNPPIIHRDIKSSNVLIDSKFNSRVSDFGLALRGHVEDAKAKSTPPAGTLGYLDPGYIVPGDLSTKSDVFSFGILLLEIISGRKAIDVNYSPPSVVEWAVPEIKSGNYAAICDPRIGTPDNADALQRMAVLAARCVRNTTTRRPAMAEALDSLKDVYRRMKRRNQNCMKVRRRVASQAVKYKPLDESVGVGRTNNKSVSRKSGKLSGATGAELMDDTVGHRVGRSKSIGTTSEIKLLPSGVHRRVGLSAEISTVRLSKSRSTGSKRLVSNDGMDSRRLEESKLLLKNGNGEEAE